jgi:chemotaxis protein CheD
MGWVAPSIRKGIIVGVADMAVSNDPAADLVTYSLGSCLGITLHDAEAGVGGLLHVMLPDSTIDHQKAENQPHMFVDTGIPQLFRAAYQLGATKSRIVLKVAGGADVLDSAKIFNIGTRNFKALEAILTKNSVRISASDVGGHISRTIRLDVSKGTLKVQTVGKDSYFL